MCFPFADAARIQFKGDMFDTNITSRLPLGPNSIGTIDAVSTPPHHFQVRWDRDVVRKYPNRDAYNFCLVTEREKLLFSDKLLEKYAYCQVDFNLVEMVECGRISDAQLMNLRTKLRGGHMGAADTLLLCSQICELRDAVSKQAALILRDSKFRHPMRPPSSPSSFERSKWRHAASFDDDYDDSKWRRKIPWTQRSIDGVKSRGKIPWTDAGSAMGGMAATAAKGDVDESPWRLDDEYPSFDATSIDEDFETIANTFGNS